MISDERRHALWQLLVVALVVLLAASIALLVIAWRTKPEHVLGAAEAGKVDRLGFLLMLRPDLVNAADERRRTALHFAAERGDYQVGALLVARGAELNPRALWGCTPLHHAVQEGRKQMVEFLLANNADLSARDLAGRTLLHYAAGRGDTEIGGVLLAAGADANPSANDGKTPLHEAAEGNHKEMLELLLANGADVNSRHSNGSTALHHAVAWGDMELVELLLLEGADVNATDREGATPLHDSASRGYRELAGLLLANGADPNLKDAEGQLPVDLATKYNQWNVVALLKKHCGQEWPVRVRMPREEHVDPAMRQMLSQHLYLDFDETPVRDVLEFLQAATGPNLVVFWRELSMDGAPLTLQFVGTLEEALNRICALSGMAWAVQGQAIKIAIPETLRSGVCPRVGAIHAGMQKDLERAVSLTFDETPVVLVFDFLRDVTDLEYIVREEDLPEDGGLITLHFQGTLQQALDLICWLTDMSWQCEKAKIKIIRAKSD